tara:strand:+ start:51 stop:299 length:249 start_codon:yes stop_codon:yes gene_type:complete
MLDLLNTLAGYYFIGIIVSIIALYLLLYVDWFKVFKSYISWLVILFITLLMMAGQYFFAFITIALIIIFWKKIPKSFLFWEN